MSGLGAIVIQAGNSFKTADMFVPIIVVMAFGIGLTALVVGAQERNRPLKGWTFSLLI